MDPTQIIAHIVRSLIPELTLLFTLITMLHNSITHVTHEL